MARNFTYVDNSNVYVEGARVSAVMKGLPGAATIIEAMNNRVVDFGWQIDYGSLHDFAVGGDPSQIGAANLWGSPPPGDSFWKMVEQYGFKVTKFDRNAAGREKKVDVAIAHLMTKQAYTGVVQKGDEMTLVAGDKDYVPVVEDLVANNFIVHVVFWDHAARELRETASKFVSLNPYFDYLTKQWQPTK